MSKIEVRFVKTHVNAQIPCKAHNDDSGYDVYSVEDFVVPAKGSVVVPVGLIVSYIQEGYWLRVESRSGLSFKYGVLAHPGVIDNGYRGNLDVKLYNLSDKDYVGKSGERIAQLVFYPIIESNIKFSDTVIESNRGNNGFGSSGR